MFCFVLDDLGTPPAIRLCSKCSLPIGDALKAFIQQISLNPAAGFRSEVGRWTMPAGLQLCIWTLTSTGDPTALTCAEGLVTNAFNRWLDNQLGGGMWYSDAEQVKSLYQVAIVLSALKIYELTGDQTCYTNAMRCYTWMETYLLRSNIDNLYWCDYNASGPVGQNRPEDIQEAGSVVFLGGNMGMALLHARLYQLTGDTNYLNRAIRTVNAIYNSPLVTSTGIYLDDRDAWTEGTFAGDFAREVLSLPGMRAVNWTVLGRLRTASTQTLGQMAILAVHGPDQPKDRVGFVAQWQLA